MRASLHNFTISNVQHFALEVTQMFWVYFHHHLSAYPRMLMKFTLVYCMDIVLKPKKQQQQQKTKTKLYWNQKNNNNNKRQKQNKQKFAQNLATQVNNKRPGVMGSWLMCQLVGPLDLSYRLSIMHNMDRSQKRIFVYSWLSSKHKGQGSSINVNKLVHWTPASRPPQEKSQKRMCSVIVGCWRKQVNNERSRVKWDNPDIST